MFRIFFISGCLLMTSLFSSCNSGSEAETLDPETTVTQEEVTTDTVVEVKEIVWEADEVNKSSELALLMRKMWEENMELKEIVANGGKIDSFPKSYYTIHSATATNPDEINNVYHSFADMYLNSMNNLTDPGNEDDIAAFNNMVKACVDCHQQYCHGPIPKIKKLYIKSEPGS